MALAVAFGVMRPRGPGNATVKGTPRVVVLPFDNLGDSSRQYFANGVTEAITTQLTGIAGLSVIPRSTAARYRGTTKSLEEIGRELGVTYVLEGTVQFEEVKDSAPRVRVSPELIRVADTSSVWAHGYDAVMTSVFQVYSDVASEVAKSLAVALDDPERRALAVRPTANAEAYDLYLRAIDYLTRGISTEVFNNAVPMLERAVVLDSTFALAWGALSETLALSHWLYISHTDETMARAKAAAERALALQPDLPEAHRAMGNYYYRRREYDKALAEFAIAQRGRPNDIELISAIAYVERRQGRWQESVDQMERWRQLDPGSARVYYSLGETLQAMRRYDEAEPVLRHGVEIAPDEPDCYSVLIETPLLQRGDLAAAQAELRRALQRMSPTRLNGNFRPLNYVVALDDTLRRTFLAVPLAVYGSDTATYYSYRGDLHRLTGEAPQARALYDSARVFLEASVRRLPDDYWYHARLGLVYASLGRNADAVREGKRAVELLPPSRDAYFGIDNVMILAEIYAATGQPGEAVEQLKIALAVPSDVSSAELRVNPAWNPIRSDPGFQALMR